MVLGSNLYADPVVFSSRTPHPIQNSRRRSRWHTDTALPRRTQRVEIRFKPIAVGVRNARRFASLAARSTLSLHMYRTFE